MKRLLMLLLLLPASAGADHYGLVSEEWTTYCDGGVEKVRASLVFRVPPEAIFGDTWGGELSASSTGCPYGYGPSCDRNPGLDGVTVALGSGLYQWKWEGWSRECLSTAVTRSGAFWFMMPDPIYGGTMHYAFYLECSDGPKPIVDGLECVPLPVASSTWGAIKALYRSTGDMP